MNESDKKIKINNRDYFFFGFVVVAAFLVTISSVTLAYQIKKVEDENNSTEDSAQESHQLYWEITKIEPNSDNSSQFDITIESNAGNIRNYKGLYSFGISKDGTKLATNSLRGLEIIDLESDTAKSVSTPTEVFRGDSGNVISWSSSGKYFALSIINNQNVTDTRIWIFNDTGDIQKEITAFLPTYEGSVISVEPVYFSKNGELLLTRTYLSEDMNEVKEDGSKYKVGELPIFLTVFDVGGKKVKEFMVRDFDTQESNILYGWDQRNDKFIKYYVFEKGQTPDFSSDYLFTKIAI